MNSCDYSIDENEVYDYFIQRWHNLMPYDYSYRKVYNIGFLSKEHLELSIKNIRIWARECIFEKRANETPEEKRQREIDEVLKRRKNRQNNH